MRDTQGYVLANALGKSIFDYHSEQVRSHQDDWKGLLRWLKILVVISVVALIGWMVFNAIAEVTFFEWIGDRIDALTE